MNSDRTPAPTGPLVLVVEDEPLLRLAAVEMVEDAGYVAVEAADAFEAVRILESRDDIRIVFTDIDMPGGMSGVTLAAAIRDRWPPIDIIMTSGRRGSGRCDGARTRRLPGQARVATSVRAHA